MGAWEGTQLVGGLLLNTPDSPEWGDVQETLTQEFGRQIDPDACARLLAFESMLNQNEPQLDVPYFYIDTIAVHPDYQGKGYARGLIEHVSDMSHRHSTSGAVCLSTEDAENHAFYRHLEFEEMSQATLDTITSTGFKRLT